MQTHSLIRGVYIAATLLFLPKAFALDIPLGGLGGYGDLVPDTGLVEVRSLAAGGPADLAGLQAGDFIRGADGVQFSTTSADAGTGFVGAIQDLAMALDRAEGANGQITLNVIRGGVGGLDVPVNVGTPGALGPAWPAGSAKADAMYEWGCAQIHSQVQASSNGDFGYNSGWYGMILLSHPDWNQTSGANPYRNSINKLRTRCENFINGRILEPQEAYYHNGSAVVANPNYVSPGLENWDVCTSSMFLALYRVKTGDVTANAVVQTAAECIANRIQTWTQWDDYGNMTNPPGGGIGRMGHGGVHGDYSHYNGIGALNIINAHALPALALLKSAGANMNFNLGLSVNSQGIYSYETLQLTPTIEEKFRMCWDYVKAATTNNGGGDDGNVGYVGKQSGWDSAGRTPGCFAGWHLYGMAANADDTDKQQRMADYFPRRWYRQQHSHAYTLGGVVLSQLAMPFLSDRNERFFQENTRLYPALARKPDGSIDYFPGRQNNGGDSYLNYSRVGIINATMPMAIRSGNLPGFSLPDPARIHAWMRSPVNSWPAIDARRAVLTVGLNHTLDLDVTDVDGNILNPGDYTAAWTHVSGPGVTTFGNPNSVDTTVTFPGAGTYRVNLEVTRGGYTLDEPYDLVVSSDPEPSGIIPYVVADPTSQSADQGDTVTFTVDAQGTGPLIYQWRLNGSPLGSGSTSPQYVIDSVAAGSVGGYDCVITNAYGTVISGAANLSVTGVGDFHWGGLWRDAFIGISGSYVSNLTSSASFPNFPDASGVITNAEAPANYTDNYGQRWSGWVTAPESGSYFFYISSDDESELWLSTDATRANRQLVARVSDGNDTNGAWWTDPRQWNKFANQKSAAIALTGGQRYYIEVLQKDGGSLDGCAVTWNWQSPGVWATPANGSTPLPGAILEYQTGGTLDNNASPPADYPPLAHGQTLVIYGGAATAVTLTGEDFEGGPLGFSIVDGPTKGVLSGTAPNLTYTPNGGASGTDGFTFKVNDGGQDSEIATVILSLIPETGGNLKVWNGQADNLWTAALNWEAGATPGGSDAVIFNSSSLNNLATTLAGNQSIRRLVVENPAGAVTIADNTLTIANGIEMRPATEDLTITSAVALGASQEWSVGEGRTLVASGAISGSATLTKTGGGTLSFEALSPFTGGIVVKEGTVLLNKGSWYTGYAGGPGTVTVQDGGTAINMLAHAFGSGTGPNRDIVLLGGRFRMQKESYVDDISMTAGTIDNPSGATGDIRARSGSGTVVTVNAAADPSVISCPFTMTGSATFNVADGAAVSDLWVSGPLTNSGALTKSGAGRMTLAADSTHTGTVNVTAGRLAVTGSLALDSDVTVGAGAFLEGTGTVHGFVDNFGRVSPGVDGIAVLTVGTFTQLAGASTVVELKGTTAGSGHDQLAVIRAATLAGVLDVELAAGFIPAVDDSFTVVSYGSRVGSFDTINLPALPPDREWVTAYDPIDVSGLVVSVVGVSPFLQWQQDSFGAESSNPAVAGELVDPDHDTIPNLLEYALNLDPNEHPASSGTPGHYALPAADKTTSEIALIYRRNLAATDLIFTVEESDDMGASDPWSAATVTESVLSDDGDTQVIRAAVSAPGEHKFLRLRVIH